MTRKQNWWFILLTSLIQLHLLSFRLWSLKCVLNAERQMQRICEDDCKESSMNFDMILKYFPSMVLQCDYLKNVSVFFFAPLRRREFKLSLKIIFYWTTAIFSKRSMKRIISNPQSQVMLIYLIKYANRERTFQLFIRSDTSSIKIRFHHDVCNTMTSFITLTMSFHKSERSKNMKLSFDLWL